MSNSKVLSDVTRINEGNTSNKMTTNTLTPPASDLEIETGAIIRELQNRLINDNPLNYRKDE